MATDCAPAAFRWPFCPGVWNPAQQRGRFEALAAGYFALPGCEWPCGHYPCEALRAGGRLACVGERCEYLCTFESATCQ
ncbi:MAG: hypothetical protein IT371_16655 [Deltaproteobacteria bacterium]|nr:hypothetical protein [Deltaproteobacteria bacterium]